MQQLIHIHAKSNHFEIWEHIPVEKCVERLEQIRDAHMIREYIDKKSSGTLKVKTRLINPTLF